VAAKLPIVNADRGASAAQLKSRDHPSLDLAFDGAPAERQPFRDLIEREQPTLYVNSGHCASDSIFLDRML
jgi:hypothetical protein